MEYTTKNGFVFHIKDRIGYKEIKDFRVKGYDEAPSTPFAKNYHTLEVALKCFVDKVVKDGKEYTPEESFEIFPDDSDIVEVVHQIILPKIRGEDTKKK